MTILGATYRPVMVPRRTGGTTAVQARIPDAISKLEIDIRPGVAKECAAASEALRALASVRLRPAEHLLTGAQLGHALADAVQRAAAAGERRPAFPSIDEQLERRHDFAVLEFARAELPGRRDLARLATAVGAARDGRFRSVLGIMGDPNAPEHASLVGPPASEVPRLVDDLLAWSSRDDVDPIVQAALAEFQLGAIHPYEQGNGRSARALALAVLARRGLVGDVIPPLSVVLAARRDEYISVKETAQRGAPVDDWISHLARALRLAADAALPHAVDLHTAAPVDAAWLLELSRRTQRRRSRLLRAFGLD